MRFRLSQRSNSFKGERKVTKPNRLPPDVFFLETKRLVTGPIFEKAFLRSWESSQDGKRSK
jgi:hypothetical protein